MAISFTHRVVVSRISEEEILIKLEKSQELKNNKIELGGWE